MFAVEFQNQIDRRLGFHLRHHKPNHEQIEGLVKVQGHWVHRSGLKCRADHHGHCGKGHRGLGTPSSFVPRV